MRDAEEVLVSVGDARLWTARSGSGPPLLLCSGGPGCCDYLAPVAEMVDDLCSVHRFEARGCGRSEPSPPYDVETCVRDLEALREAWGLERWAVGGHSWGANLGLAYALKHPERVSALLYLCGNGAQNDRAWSLAYHEALEARGELQPDYLFPPNMSVNAECNASWRSFFRQPRFWRRVAELDVPALVVIAELDIRPSWPAEQLAALLPNAQQRVLSGAEHSIWLSGDPQAAALRQELRGFLSGPAAVAPRG